MNKSNHNSFIYRLLFQFSQDKQMCMPVFQCNGPNIWIVFMLMT